MKALLFALLSLCAALPTAAASSSCDAAAVDSLQADIAAAKAAAPLVDSVRGDSYDESRRFCASAAQKRLMSGQHPDEFLVCVTLAPEFSFGSDLGARLGARRFMSRDFTTELRSLEPQRAQALCDRLNACLFELFDQPTSALYQRLSASWDGLSCVGE